jgi:hypothetical protein
MVQAAGIAGPEESTLQPSSTPDPETCWALLERVAASTQLRRSVRLQELLFYIGKRYLKDGCDRVHEQEIGLQVFKRPDSYDTSFDNIVRTNVSDLRKRIEAYFQSEGAREPLIVEIPRGGYTPVFRFRAAEPVPPSAELAAENRALNQDATQSTARSLPSPPHRVWKSAALVATTALSVALAIGCSVLWRQLNAVHQTLFAWQSKPSVAELWTGIFNANPDTDIVISDDGIGMVETLTKRTFQLDDYLNRNYVEQIQSQNLSPDMRTAVNRILVWNLASPDEFALSRRLLALDPMGKKLHLYNARNYMPDLIKRDNVILIGARKSNPWDELFDGQLNFITEFGSPRVINLAPAPGEQSIYPNVDSVSYCVVAYLPKPDRTGVVLLIEGTSAEATEAAGDFLLSEDQLSSFKKLLHATRLPYFQVLLKVSAVRGTPLDATVQAYRAYPNLH